MKMYKSVFFVQGEEALPYLDMIEEAGPGRAIEAILDNLDEGLTDETPTNTPPWGTVTRVYRIKEHPGYVLTHDRDLAVGLVKEYHEGLTDLQKGLVEFWHTRLCNALPFGTPRMGSLMRILDAVSLHGPMLLWRMTRGYVALKAMGQELNDEDVVHDWMGLSRDPFVVGRIEANATAGNDPILA